MQFRIGTRASALALWQANWVATQLKQHGYDSELVHISTQGDQQQLEPVQRIGNQGVFTKELQRALLEDRIDIAVHSLKDLPTDPVDSLTLAAVPFREAVDDVLISREGLGFQDLPQAAVIGTGSLRRQTQLLHARPDLQMRDIRGNVDTRLAKLADGQYDAIILAHAGLKRLGLQQQITEVLPQSLILPAVGQGALGLETRLDDLNTRSAVERLNDERSHQAVLAERSLLAALRGGCLAPIGAWARFNAQEQLLLDAVVLSHDGTQRLYVSLRDNAEAAVELGQKVAAQLEERGAFDLIQNARKDR